MEKPYTALAQLLNCHPDEIAVVTSATAAWFQVHVIAYTLSVVAQTVLSSGMTRVPHDQWTCRSTLVPQ